MFYREAGDFKVSYQQDSQTFPIKFDRYRYYAVMVFAFLAVPFLINDYWANAILLPYCMNFNRDAILEPSEVLARHLGLKNPGFDTLMAWILDFREMLGIPSTLAVVEEMSEEACDELAPLAKVDPALLGNPKPATERELAGILKNALAGSL